MRIAYICSDSGIPVFGQKGCSIHVQEIIRGFLKQNAKVDLFSPRIADTYPDDLKLVSCHQLESIPKVEPALREKLALSLNYDLQVKLASFAPYDLIYERYSLWSYGAIEYAQKKGIMSILEVNSPLILEQQKHRELIDLKAAEQVAKKVFNAATIIIAVSQAIKDYLIQYVDNPEKIKVIPNGVDPQRFTPLRSLNSCSVQFTIGFVGSLKPWHGLPILIEVFEQFHHDYPHSKLLIIGDGTERDNLIKEIKQRNLQSFVQLTGAVSPHVIPFLLNQMDVAVAPYPPLDDFYFSPLKIYEYMASGLPVVASEIGQITEVINNGVNGLLYPPGDVTALKTALEKLWNLPQLRYDLGIAARQTIIDNHTWDKVVKQIFNLVEKTEKKDYLTI